jgi:hypothetical protein
LAAISHVFTITYVAEMLGEDEDWLHELSIDMFPEDGCLHVYHGHDDAVTAFTDYGIENLKQIIADMRADGRAPRRTLSRTNHSAVLTGGLPINASCGISTLPNWRMRFLPSFCFSNSLRLRVTSPP